MVCTRIRDPYVVTCCCYYFVSRREYFEYKIHSLFSLVYYVQVYYYK